MKKSKQTFTDKGRLRTCPMPNLYGKEWTALKSVVQSLAGIDASLKDLVEIERQKFEVENIKLK